jgi:hypothetical protein
MEQERREEQRVLNAPPDGVMSTMFSISSDSESSSTDINIDCERMLDELNDRVQNRTSSFSGLMSCDDECRLNRLNTNDVIGNSNGPQLDSLNTNNVTRISNEWRRENNNVDPHSSNTENCESSSQDIDDFNFGTITQEYS